jgi:hypothetical protein
MSAAKPQKTTKEKAKSVRLPPVADYSDVVTDEHFGRIRALVPEADYHDAEVVSGPAW